MGKHEPYPVPLRCRLGFHLWFSDGCGIYSATRCGYCGRWRTKKHGRRMALAGLILDDEYAKSGSFDEQQKRAKVRFKHEVKVLGL